MHLGKVRNRYDKIKQLGAEVLTVTNDSPEALRKYKAKTNTRFLMLSDKESSVIREYDIENRWEPHKRGVAHPSTYIIDRQGIVRFAEVRRNYLFRINISTILDELKALADHPVPAG